MALVRKVFLSCTFGLDVTKTFTIDDTGTWTNLQSSVIYTGDGACYTYSTVSSISTPLQTFSTQEYNNCAECYTANPDNIFYTFSSCCDNTTFSLRRGDFSLEPYFYDGAQFYWELSSGGTVGFTGCTTAIVNYTGSTIYSGDAYTYYSSYVQGWADCDACLYVHPCKVDETPTPTPTITQTVTPSEPYDVYLFEECGNSSNQFRFENVPGTLNVGDVYLINGPYFNGYATVIPYATIGSLYPSIGSTFTGAPSCPTPTPTPTVTQTQTQTPSVTPTNTLTPSVTPTNGECNSIYCFRTTLPSLSGYSGNYTQTGTYNLNYYYEGDGTEFGVIYYTGSYWCLSNSLGGSCLLEGATPCYSTCPDISANYFNGGPCPTPTPSSVNCEPFNFNAYFDCDWEPLPTPSVSVDCGDVNFDVTSVGVTPTPTPSGDFCNGTGVSFLICQYDSTTPTPTTTPTITITKTVDVQGQATFVMLDELFECVNVKVLIDCETGNQLYTSDNLMYEGTPITTGITMSVIIGGNLMCVTYTGTSNTISSNCNIDEIIAISSSCGNCNVFPSPTPTDTPTQTQTPTLTPTTTMNATPTTTPGASPTPTPHWVYVYESCEPIGQQFINTQVIQTVKITSFTNLVVDQTFQDNQGRCWKYIGRFTTNYIAPSTVSPITYSGNYFGSQSIVSNVFDTCSDCLNFQGAAVTYTGNYTPAANSAQNACFLYGITTLRPYYSNTNVLAVGVRIYDTYASVPTNGNNKWIVLKLNPTSNLGTAVQINTSGYITAIQNVNTNSC